MFFAVRLGVSFFGVYFCLCFFFFFQAEDGIRDRDVTGVQTCALPIWVDGWLNDWSWLRLLTLSCGRTCEILLRKENASAPCFRAQFTLREASASYRLRSEERRVGKECRSRWSP